MLADGKARERALDPTGSFIVQAPAGSGKTELLTQRFLVLLSTVRQPEEILAMTFTRKSAAEMRSRIITALKVAETEPCPNTPHGQKTWELAQAVLTANKKNKWHLPENPERLRIQTIDAFNSTLTRQLPLLSGFGAPPEIAQQPYSLYLAAVRSLVSQLEQDLPWSDAIATVLTHLDCRMDSLEKLLIRLLERRDQWLPYMTLQSTDNQLRELLENQLARVTHDILQNLVNLMPDDLSSELLSLTGFAADNLGEAPPEFFPGADITDRDAWLYFRKLLMTDKDEWRKAINKNNGFPADNKIMKQRMLTLIGTMSEIPALQNALRELHTSPEPYFSEKQWQMLEALHQVLRVAVAELRLQFQQHGRIDYTENALAALVSLGPDHAPTDLALALDCRLQHLLVDEFQDTSATQFRLLQKLTMGWESNDGRTLFLVGDPMQSIYRFREAEVGLFIRARKHGIGHLPLESLQLTVNFRSIAGIVNWVNAHFPHVFPTYDDVATGAVSYSPGIAADKTETTSDPVRLFSGTLKASQQGQHVVTIIKERRAADPDETIAILVRARTHLVGMMSALKNAGLHWSAIGIDPLFERPVIQDLISLTRALTNPDDRTAWLAILRAPWCGLTLNDLLVIAGTTADVPILKRLTTNLALSSTGTASLARILPVLLERFRHRERFTLRYQIESAWLLLGGPACMESEADLKDAEVFFRLLEQLDQEGVYPSAEQLKDSVKTLFAAPDPNINNPIQIMTIHNAKGLEFGTVIIPHLEKSVSADKKELMLWMERPSETEETALLFAPVHAVGDKNDSIYTYIRDENAIRNVNEQSRLLYVAVTRAKKNLCLLFDLDEKGKPASGSLLSSLWSSIQAEVPLPTENINTEAPTESASEPYLLKRLPVTWNNVLHETPIEDTLATHITAQGFLLSDASARYTGTVIHTIIQTLCETGGTFWENHPNRNAWIMNQLQQVGILPSACADAAVTVQQAIDTLLQDERGQWIIHPHTEAASEFAVSTLLDDKPVSLIIDRTFIDQEGIRWIIDFKTSHCTDGNLASFLKDEQLRYQKQMDRYQQAMLGFDERPIRMALYFPLIPAFHEITISD